MTDYSAFYTDEFMREHRAMLAALAASQRPCPHCGYPLVASVPAGAAKDAEKPQTGATGDAEC